MAFNNSVNLIGNLTRDPELRFLASGTAVCDFGVAWTQKGYNGGEDVPHFFDVVAWAGLGEHVADSFRKGDRVVVSGALDFQQWETDAGEKRSKVRVKADDVGGSVLWATASMVRVERSETGSGGGGGGKPAARPAARVEYVMNEEPFVEDAADWMPGMWGTYPERKLS